jgi:hypothetical protein
MKLTRREVAATLQKSIATIRRLEGHVLHPQRDARGTHWFDLDEVERLRMAPHRAKPWARSKWLRQRMGIATRDAAHRRHPAPRALFDACEMVAMTARRGRFASRHEVIISLEAFSELLNALASGDGERR